MKVSVTACFKNDFHPFDCGGNPPCTLLENGTVLTKQPGLYGRDYFLIFGKLKVPRSCYRSEYEAGVMPLDAMANLPDRCYSYLLQEWMNICNIRDSFKESQISLNKLLGLEISQSRFEVISRESAINYDLMLNHD
ncbi:hypothetical protein MTBBW1_20015 [Desulfamplus magnetovallimortis]|uniref:Uncharacterized protein n=1 Tax=Desulfamplus magnetovallimortis TaxID=1246637 RepID=A0A1W1HBR1_9BACT|nr:hypothetical protein [Desulfamplus magnetovallimortis]SLM29818.1 hypothetical protein MTBBW1_20015 [Desulfamplus magnetovallimortis]